MGDRLPLVKNEKRRNTKRATSPSQSHTSTSTTTSAPSPDTRSTPTGRTTPGATGHHTYEELMHGHIPCPSCRGAGRIPKELEQQLVALIPVDDARLKPRRTWLYVLLGVCAAVFVFGLVGFFLAPRSVTLRATSDVAQQVIVLDYVKGSYMVLKFENTLFVRNENYFSITVVNATSTIVNKFQPFTEEYFGHVEQDTVQTKQQVCCLATGNCTSLEV